MRPYLRAANVDWSGLKLDDVKEMNFTDAELEVYRLEKDDIVLTEASGSPNEVGKSAIWSGEIADCCFQNTLIRVRTRTVDPGYLHMFLTLEAVRKAFVADARGVGINHLGSSRLSNWRVPVPPLSEQPRIAAAIDEYLRLVKAAERTFTELSRRTAHLHSAILREVRETALLQGAELRAVGSIAETSLGKMLDARQTSGEPTPYLRNVNVRWGHIDMFDLKQVPLSSAERERFTLRRGDVLVCEGGEPGRCAVWNVDKSGICYQKALHRVRVSEQVLSDWFALMLTEAITNRRADHLFTGTTIKHLPQQQLRRIEIPVPSILDQQSALRVVEAEIQACQRMKEAIVAGSERSMNLTHAILNAAFSGDLVDHDPTDEAADVLLDRIRAERKAAAQKKHRTRKVIAQ
jgi:type I restriction enzyme S subunit